VQAFQPPGVVGVGLGPAGDLLDGVRVDQPDGEPASFEQLVPRHPVDAGGPGATVSMPHFFSQAAMASRSQVLVRKERTDWSSRSGGR
jgi:hypothetical protein